VQFGRAHDVHIAAGGIPAGLNRDRDRFAVVDGARLRHLLSSVSRRTEVVAEANGWSVFIAGTPVAAEGATLDQAIHEVVKALRKYAADWIDHLSTAPNQSGNWGSSAGSRVGGPVRDASVRTKATCRW